MTLSAAEWESAEMAYVTTGLPNSGLTAHYQIEYDESLSPEDGLDRALALLGVCEQDYDLMAHWFGNIALPWNPVPIQIASGAGPGAGWGPPVTLVPGDGTPLDMVRYLLVAEVTEMFMLAQNKGWFHGVDEGSDGEGLSLFLGEQFLASIAAAATPIEIANYWMGSARLDYVNHVDPYDRTADEKTGCAILFIYYLYTELGFDIPAIIAGGGAQLSDVYENLTGDATDPFPNFKCLLDSAYPGTATISGANTNNPWPLPESPECPDLRTKIDELKADIRSWEHELVTPPIPTGAERAAIIHEIDGAKAELETTENRAKALCCGGLQLHPTGGSPPARPSQ